MHKQSFGWGMGWDGYKFIVGVGCVLLSDLSQQLHAQVESILSILFVLLCLCLPLLLPCFMDLA